MNEIERKQLIEWLQIHDKGEIQATLDCDRDGYMFSFWHPDSEEGFSIEIDSENINQ